MWRSKSYALSCSAKPSSNAYILLTEKCQPGLSDNEQQVVLQRINTIRRVLSKVSKPLLWKVRDRVGTRIRWYTEVEEVDQ
jgi:hypothetical protein